MIEWIPYDKNSREIESHRDHLATDGTYTWILQHAKIVTGASGYAWFEELKPFKASVITHWSRINLPQAIVTTESARAVGGVKL